MKKLDIFGKKKAIEDRLTKWILEDKSRFEKYGSVVKDLEEANKEIANANGTKILMVC